MSELAQKSCIPCRGDASPLQGAALKDLLSQLEAGWEVVDNHHLSRTFAFPDFARALAYVNTLGAIAEKEGHHPDLLLRWGSVRMDIWTHTIDGLTESDFILAAKASVAYASH
ncbi:MAG: 4a-hydroxytetrahydrobiopterin dehydratase [Myxococcota bacterium]|nr:4a-hydroxytetrahydrobiopterin dehydratase [Myxococcota bacterium]